MKSLLWIMLPALGIGTLLALFGDRLGFGVNPLGVWSGSMAVGLLLWVIWHATATRRVDWPGPTVESSRRITADWATETLIANALRGSDRSLKELSRALGEAGGEREDISDALRQFIDAGRGSGTVPAINRRTLHAFLKEIA